MNRRTAQTRRLRGWAAAVLFAAVRLVDLIRLRVERLWPSRTSACPRNPIVNVHSDNSILPILYSI